MEGGGRKRKEEGQTWDRRRDQSLELKILSSVRSFLFEVLCEEEKSGNKMGDVEGALEG